MFKRVIAMSDSLSTLCGAVAVSESVLRVPLNSLSMPVRKDARGLPRAPSSQPRAPQWARARPAGAESRLPPTRRSASLSGALVTRLPVPC